jgi:hypothetical protein
MDPTIILVAILAAPVLVLMILRVNAAQIFLSLCLGAVLVQFVAPDAAVIVSSASAQHKGVPSSLQAVELVLQLLPVVLTTVIMIGSIKGKARLAFNLLPALGVGALLALLTVPLLPASLTDSITAITLWHKLQALWMQRPRRHEEKK